MKSRDEKTGAARADSVEPWHQSVRARLRARESDKPHLKARQILMLWPEIAAALAAGQTLKTIRDWLEEEEIAVSYGALTSYVSRIRRRMKPVVNADFESTRDENTAEDTASVAPEISPVMVDAENEPPDPLRNVRERNASRPGFEYPPGVDEEALI
jgi:hypothetical protein